MSPRWIILMTALIFNTGCSVFGIRTAEELSYTVVEKQDAYEIRTYDSYIAAEASLDGNYKNVQRELFKILAGYIFGKNSVGASIKMTRPVVIDPNENESEKSSVANGTDTSTRIAMTAPVTMKKLDNKSWTMAFSMPSDYTMKTLPLPEDTRIKIVQVPKRTVAVIRFSGRYGNDSTRAEKTKSLKRWLNKLTGYRPNGEPYYAGYDPPFTLPFLRRNEVLIEVDPL